MFYSRDYIAFLCRDVIRKLSQRHIKLGSPEVVNEKVREAVTNELGAEDRLNDEVRTLLERYAGEMREAGASYAESFKRVKRQLMKERGVVPTSGRDSGEGSRISRDKVNKLSHVVLETLIKLKKEVELLVDKNDVRLEVFRLFTEHFPPQGGQGVVLAPPPVDSLPVGGEPAVLLHAVQGRVKEALFHLEVTPAALLELLADLVAIHSVINEQAED